MRCQPEALEGVGNTKLKNKIVQTILYFSTMEGALHLANTDIFTK